MIFKKQMDISTRIEIVCTKVLTKRKEFSVERKRINNRSVFLKTSKRDNDILDKYLEDTCSCENVSPKSIRKILS